MDKRELIDEYIDGERDSYYDDWLSDNKAELMKEFVAEHEDDFSQFCKDAFKEETGRRI